MDHNGDKHTLKTGERRNLGTFQTPEKAELHARLLQFFKRPAGWLTSHCQNPALFCF
jgi:hypothetical protein